MNSLRVLVMAGGTGGHVFPALAVADALRKNGAEIHWLGTARGIESRLVPAANIELHCLSIAGVRGKGLTGLLKAPWLISKAVVEALSVIRKFRPQVVVGFGGFASGPGGVAARIARIPLVIHEQNAVAGTTNRLLAKIAQRILAAFPNAYKNNSVPAQVVGNPVRAAIEQLPPVTARYAERVSHRQSIHLLVLGGSQGAKAVNELVPRAIAVLDSHARPQVWHQAGGAHHDTTASLYESLQLDARVDAFITDMAEAYAWADIIICRAGALTVSEIMAAGVASLLIPLPNAIDDHQTWNARILVDAGAGVLAIQKDLTAEKLAALLLTQFADRAAIKTMAEKARALAEPESAARVANICVEVARG